MIPVQLLAIRLNEHQKLAKVEQAGSEMTKALSQNVAICCAYFHKYDSDRHYNVVIADSATSDRGSSDK